MGNLNKNRNWLSRICPIQMDLSEYYSNLSVKDQKIYLTKMNIIGADPYVVNMEECTMDMEKFPRILYPDIVNYFVFSKSIYTMEEMRAYKSLEAYNQAVCGWVRQLVCKEFGEYSLILAKVSELNYV